jgi:hypothetical protein
MLNFGWSEVLVILGGLVCVGLFVFGIAGAVYFVATKGRTADGRRAPSNTAHGSSLGDSSMPVFLAGSAEPFAVAESEWTGESDARDGSPIEDAAWGGGEDGGSWISESGGETGGGSAGDSSGGSSE